MLTFKDAMTEFFNHCRYEKNLSAKTLKFYQIVEKGILRQPILQYEKAHRITPTLHRLPANPSHLCRSHRPQG